LSEADGKRLLAAFGVSVPRFVLVADAATAGAAALVPPWLAALGMTVSSLLVTLNALRLARVKGAAASAPVPGGDLAGAPT